MGTAARTKSIRTVCKVSREDRLDHQQHGHLDHSVLNGRDPQRSQLAVGFWDVDPANRLVFVRLGLQLLFNLIEENLHTILAGLDGFNGYPINSSSTTVGMDWLPGRLQYIPSKDPIIQYYRTGTSAPAWPCGPASIATGKVSGASQALA